MNEGDNKEAYIDYEFGDLYIKCKCGHKTPIKQAKGIEGGLSFHVYTINTSEVLLECEECKHSMSLYFEEAEKIVDLKAEKAYKDRKINEAILEGLQAAQIADREDKIEDDTVGTGEKQDTI
jgi:hypothetical protein